MIYCNLFLYFPEKEEAQECIFELTKYSIEIWINKV